ncbi:MAG: dephospho-CoA kinase [Hymenobacteraceae bacterium]|nr:dephospho-CoA kinase [Hymenobacteraceae bacterium]
MLTVGLTGGIGAGKSVVKRFFGVLGVPTTDADARAKWLMTHDPALRAALVNEFGRAVFDAVGQLNRSWLAQRAFQDPTALARLNALVHPAVGADFAAWRRVQADAGAPYVIKEAAILFEADIARTLDCVITVAAPEEVRIRRVLARDPHRTAADVAAIIAKQLPEAERQRRADFVLWNDDLRPLLAPVLALDAELRRRAALPAATPA